MGKIELLKRFVEKEVADASHIFQSGMLLHLQENGLEKEIRILVAAFKELLAECAKKEKLEVVQYLQISLLQGRALHYQPFYTLEAFDNRFFIKEPITEMELNFPWIYKGYLHFCESVDRESHRYVSAFENEELNHLKLSELHVSNRVLKLIIENTIIFLMGIDEFRHLKFENEIQIHFGNYRGKYEIMFRSSKDTSIMGERIDEILQN